MKQLLDKKTIRALWGNCHEIMAESKAAACLLDDDMRGLINLHWGIASDLIAVALCKGNPMKPKCIRAACYHLLMLQHATTTPIAVAVR